MLQIAPPGRGMVLALGGGGARGFAHLGILRVLERNKVPISGIAGTSMGAMVGGLVAWLGDVEEAVRRLREVVEDPLFRGVPFRGFAAEEGGRHVLAGLGRRMRRSFVIAVGMQRRSIAEEALRDSPLETMFGDVRVEDFRLPFLAVAADLRTGEPVVFRSGPARLAIGASSSIVGVFPPLEWQGRWLVDGGCVRPVPVTDALVHFGGPLIGVPLPQDLQGAPATPTVLSSLARESWIKDRSQCRVQMAFADLQLRPRLGSVFWNEFDRFDECVAEGERTATEAMPRIERLCRSLRPPWRWIRPWRSRCPEIPSLAEDFGDEDEAAGGGA